MKIFWSWQSDLPGNTNRHFVKGALEEAINDLKQSSEIAEADRNELELDQDRKGVPGTPDLAATILEKIRNCEVFVADVSIISTHREKGLINPNVGIELGFALGVRGDARVLMVANEAHFNRSMLPFDLRHKAGPILFNLPDGSNSVTIRSEGAKLRSVLKEAISAILLTASKETAPKLEKFTQVPKRAGGMYFDPGDVLLELVHDQKKVPIRALASKYFSLRINPLEAVQKLSRTSAEELARSIGVMSRDNFHYTSQNAFGAIAYNYSPADLAVLQGTQVFLTGEVWCFDCWNVDRESKYGDLRGIPTGVHEHMILACVRRAIPALSRVFGFPLQVELAMVNANGNYLFMGQEYWDPYWGPIHDSRVSEVTILKDGSDRAINELCLNFFEKIFDSVAQKRPVNFNQFPAIA